MKYSLLIIASFLLMFSTTAWSGCWNDSECPSDKVCECPSSSDSGNCDSAGKCVPRGQEELQADMKAIYEPLVRTLEGELRLVESSRSKAISTTESSSSSCSGEWKRMKNNLRSQANSYCSNNVKSYGSMKTHQDKRSNSLYFCTVKTVVTCK